MEQRQSLLLLFAAVLGIAYLRGARPAAPAPPAPASAAPAREFLPPGAPPTEEPLQTWARHCGTTPAPLKPLCTALYDPAEPVPAAASRWSDLPWAGRARERLRYVVVLVSDPGLTGDTLRFDRAVESVYNAAQSAGYFMQSYWIPWPTQGGAPSAEAPKADQGPTELPGVLVFRGSEGPALVVFLVGESPISGVRRLQFLNAVHYMVALSRNSALRRVYIAGPNFSGSFGSLKQALDDASHSAGPAAIGSFRVVSQSATVRSLGAAFRRAASAGVPAIEYDSIVHNDDYLRRRLSEYVLGRWSIGPAQQAELSESVSVFGSSIRDPGMSGGNHRRAAPAADQPMTIGFPRGLFRLRNAYPEASAKSLLSSGESSEGAQERLPVTLKSAGQARDTVPSFAKEQTPVMQEAILLSIASTLHQQGITLARVEATDVFDAVFVAGFLRRANPGVRVYFGNSDLMVTRAAERQSLEGSLSVATFPLVLQNQVWSSPDSARKLLPMSSRHELGIFNALSMLLIEQKRAEPAPGGAQPEGLLEYALPDQGFPDKPPLWLTAVGTNGFWPIALLDQGTSANDPLQARFESGAPAHAGGAWPDPGEPCLLWSITFAVLTLTTAVMAGVVLLAQWPPDPRRPWLRGLARWAARPKEPGASRRSYFASAQCLILGTMLFAFATPIWMLAGHGGPPWTLVCSAASAAAFLAATAAAAAPQMAILRYHRPAPAEEGPADGYKWPRLVIFIAYCAFLGTWWFGTSYGRNLEAFFFSYRSLDLLNGLSPVLPCLLLGAGYLLVNLLHQHRAERALAVPRRLPALGDEAAVNGIASVLDQVTEPLRHPVLSNQRLGWMIASAGFGILLFFPMLGQQSLESGTYDFVYKATFVALYLLVVCTWARFLLVWVRLRTVLNRLACHPIRLALASLPHAYWPPSTVLGGVRVSVVDLVSDSLQVLRAFSRSVPQGFWRPSSAQMTAELENDAAEYLSMSPSPHPAPVGQLVQIQNALAEIGTEIADSLRVVWRQGCSAALLRAEPDREARARVCPEAVRLGEEFIALQYAAFLSNVMLQLRDLLLFVICAYFLGMISPLVYPFRSQHELAWAGTFAFALMGIGVAFAVAQAEKHALLRHSTAGADRGRTASSLLRLIAYAALPLLGLISAHFPELGRHLVTLLQPAMQAVH